MTDFGLQKGVELTKHEWKELYRILKNFCDKVNKRSACEKAWKSEK